MTAKELARQLQREIHHLQEQSVVTFEQVNPLFVPLLDMVEAVIYTKEDE